MQLNSHDLPEMAASVASASSTRNCKIISRRRSATTSQQRNGFAATTRLAVAVVVVLATIGGQRALAWRLVDRHAAAIDQHQANRALAADYQPFFTNFYAPQPAQFYSNSQMLTPSTMATISSQQQQSPQAQPTATNTNEPSNQQQQPQQPQQDSPQQQQAVEHKQQPDEHKQEQQSAVEKKTEVRGASEVKAAPTQTAVEQQHQQQTTTKAEDTETVPTGRDLSPFGKILGAIAQVATNQTSAAGGSSSSSGSIGLQALKPQRTSPKPKWSVSSVEQQIINQHARVHLVGHSHQHLMPTKHRDNKLVGLIESSSSSSSDGPRGDSALAALLDHFKSGISSRSSIVKAISDNKLARTLSTVSKSIGGNKLVAGAGAAAALAALGLTVSKFLSPYASGYSKMATLGGEPMLTSSSMAQQQFLAPFVPSNDRNQYDAMFASSSIANANMQQYADSQSASLGGPFDYANQFAKQQPVYLSYNPATMVLPSTRPASSSSTSTSHGGLFLNAKQRAQLNSDLGGHYSNFYDQQPQSVSSVDEFGNQLVAYAPTSALGNTQQQQQQFIASPMQESANQEQMILPQPSSPMAASRYPPIRQQQAQDQLMSSASTINEIPIYMPRRSGTVSLRMDEATRARLVEQLKSSSQAYANNVADQMTDSFPPTTANVAPASVQQPQPATFDYDAQSNGQQASKQQQQQTFVSASASQQPDEQMTVPQESAVRNYYYAPASNSGKFVNQQSPQPQQREGQSQQYIANGLQQQQQQAPTPQPSYLIIQPKTAATSGQAPTQRQKIHSNGWQSIGNGGGGAKLKQQQQPISSGTIRQHQKRQKMTTTSGGSFVPMIEDNQINANMAQPQQQPQAADGGKTVTNSDQHKQQVAADGQDNDNTNNNENNDNQNGNGASTGNNGGQLAKSDYQEIVDGSNNANTNRLQLPAATAARNQDSQRQQHQMEELKLATIGDVDDATASAPVPSGATGDDSLATVVDHHRRHYKGLAAGSILSD